MADVQTLSRERATELYLKRMSGEIVNEDLQTQGIGVGWKSVDRVRPRYRRTD